MLTVDLWPKICDKRTVSRTWSAVQNTWVKGEFSNFVISNLRFCAGDGSRLRFWTDPWIQGMVLKSSFPRIFMLATNKEGIIKDYGSWNEGQWYWNIQLRRCLFNWELEVWNQFIDLLNSVDLCALVTDKIAWSLTPCGLYSPKSFRIGAEEQFFHDKPVESYVWTGIAPPKVELFCWKALCGKLPVITILQSRGCLSTITNKCAFCEAAETVSHLFCHCPFVWIIWCKCVSWWGISWTIPGFVSMLYVTWNSLMKNEGRNVIWKTLFFSIMWSIWLARNEKIFKQTSMTVDRLCDLIRIRLGYWLSAKFPRAGLSITNFLIGVQDLAMSPSINRAARHVSWQPPPSGSWKINVDGSSLGKPGPAGVGGVIRNHSGEVIFLFSKGIGVADSNQAELVAIIEALSLFVDTAAIPLPKLIIESDSRVEITWILN